MIFMILYYIFSFLFGAIVGSYLNVVILRLNTGKLLGNNRSECLHCGTQLLWYEMFPIISFFILKRRCRSCFSKISWQYPLVELSTAILFTLIFHKVISNVVGFFPIIFLLIFFYVIFANLIVIFVYDIYHKIIPDYPLYLFVGGGIVGNLILALYSSNFLVTFLSALISGVILYLPFYILWFVSNGRWIGYGDVRLAFGIGVFLGLARGLSALILSFWIGAIVGLLIIALGKLLSAYPVNSSLFLKLKKLTIKSEIPFAPFLIIGIFISFFFDLEVISLLTFFE